MGTNRKSYNKFEEKGKDIISRTVVREGVELYPMMETRKG